MFTHLHGHSHYSLLEAIGSPKMIVQEAKDHGMDAIALTDYNGLFGAIEFYKAAQAAEIKPIIGVELGYVYDIKMKDNNEDTGSLVLIAKNHTGYKCLLKLVSQANLHGRNNDKARVDLPLIQEHHDELYMLIGGQRSYFAKMILANEDESKIHEEIERLAAVIGKENIIIELLVQDESINPDIKKVNSFLEKTASILEITLTCANNFHYIDEADQKVSEVALAIKDGNRMFDDDRRKVTLQQHIMNEEEITTIATNNGRDAGTLQQMIENSETIAASIELEIPLGKILFPKYESPDPIKELYETHKDSLIQE